VDYISQYLLVGLNPLDSKGNYSATSNNMKLVHWPLMGGLYIWYSEEGPGRAAAPPSSLVAVPNVTAHPSTASVPITVLLYDGPLLCGLMWRLNCFELIVLIVSCQSDLVMLLKKHLLAYTWHWECDNSKASLFHFCSRNRMKMRYYCYDLFYCKVRHI